MKKLSILFLAFVTLLGLSSCTSDDDVVFIANPDAEGVQFTNAFASTYDLTQMESADVVERFVWSEIDVDVPTNINYELQGSLSDTFDTYEELASTPSNNVDVTADQLIKLAEDAELDENSSITMYFRVVASPGTANGMAHTSDVVSFTAVIPTEPVYLNLYFVGNATPDQWNNNANNLPLFRDADIEDLYHYTGKFNAGEFKLLEVLGQWQPQWGTNDGSTLAVNPGDGSDPGAFTVDTEGYYTLTVNLADMTFTMEEYDESGAATYSTIGYLGDATPGAWDNDTDMTQSTFNPHIWYAMDAAITDGEMKFRAANNWDVNWGSTTFPSGEGSLGGANIPVTAGTYDIWFNDLTGRYLLIQQGE